MRKSLAERLWAKVTKGDGCWEWTGRKIWNGYGQITLKRVPILVHRASWELANGPIPAGLWVLHHCDNRPCVRPDHLFLGTRADNIADMMAKGRQPRAIGERSAAAKLTEAGVAAVWDRLLEGESIAAVARSLGLSILTIRNIVNGRTWRHIRPSVADAFHQHMVLRYGVATREAA